MHVPIFRHKDAWAEERMAPKVADAAEGRRIVAPVQSGRDDLPKDILIVASKLKDYIRAKSGMNTSADVMGRLSEIVRLHCHKAIENAERDGRKTVMDRDF